MPNVDVIPTDKVYKCVKTPDEIRTTARSVSETRET
jgi:hypothetical protein